MVHVDAQGGWVGVEMESMPAMAPVWSGVSEQAARGSPTEVLRCKEEEEEETGH